MFAITVKYDEKRSTSSQYENVTAGVLIEASHLELTDPESLLKKTAQLFELARRSVQRELSQKIENPAPPERGFDPPSADANGQSNGNGNGRGNGHGTGNGNARRYGRPDPEPTPKQWALLHKLAKEQNLGPESIREICQRIVGQPVESLDRKAMGRLLDGLINGAAA